MTDTRLADILDAVYDLFAAETTLAALVANGALKIFDGPPTIDFSATSMLVVGGRPVQDDESETTATLDWATLGVSGQYADIDEWVFIPCGVATVGGDSTSLGMRATRRTAITIYAKAASALRASTLSIDVVMWCIPQASSLKQQQTQSGSECFIDFTAAVRTRI